MPNGSYRKSVSLQAIMAFREVSSYSTTSIACTVSIVGTMGCMPGNLKKWMTSLPHCDGIAAAQLMLANHLYHQFSVRLTDLRITSCTFSSSLRIYLRTFMEKRKTTKLNLKLRMGKIIESSQDREKSRIGAE